MGVLFRSNSIAAKMLSSFCTISAHVYLKQVLSKPLKDVINENACYELNPLKLEEGENAEQNQKRLTNQCQIFLDNITKSVDTMPASMRLICRHLKEEVGSKFPEGINRAIGGFLFLRFFVPAISTPRPIIKIKKAQRRARRGLILIAKVLQNLVNDTTFNKEPYMMQMNDFIENNKTNIRTYFDTVPSIDDSTPIEYMDIPRAKKQASVRLLHAQLCNIESQLVNELFYDDLKKILTDIGDPISPEEVKDTFKLDNHDDY